MKATKVIAMEKFKVQDRLLICGELDISASSARTTEAVLDVMEIEDATVEEADEAWETIVERRQKAEFGMDKFQVQDLLLICEELGISAGSARTKEAVLDVKAVEDVTVEEADQAWDTIIERKEKAEECERREREEAERRWLDAELRKKREQ